MWIEKDGNRQQEWKGVKEIMLFEIQHSKWVYLNPVLHEDSSNFSHK